ncbi:extracellular solute-binding protein [Thalassoporum mexicanum]|nr:extracellular solute-binding protein [Pseudanabaena sp. PCC 7367]
MKSNQLIDRRKFLIGMGAIGTASAFGLNGCSWLADPQRLQILGLDNALPGKVLKSFRSEFKQKAEIDPKAAPAEIWQTLRDLQLATEKKEEAKPGLEANTDNSNDSSNDSNKADSNSGDEATDPTTEEDAKTNAAQRKVPDLVSLSDAWLDAAIAQDLIRPIPAADLAKISQWPKLEPNWQASVTRNGQVWGVPYRWGSTVIAYRPDRTKFEIKSWADLWRPELKRRIVLPDSPREVIGLVLKKLGDSYNNENLNAIAALPTELEQLHQQVLFYSSDRYLQPLIIEDAWAVVGWSHDIEAQIDRQPKLRVVVPEEGTALWSDIWVLPKQQPRPTNSQAAYKWINYTLSPAIANQITALTDAVSTMPVNADLPAKIRANQLKFPSPEVIAKSELLQPLSDDALSEYLALWQELRSPKA